MISPIFTKDLPIGRYEVYAQRPEFNFKKVNQIHSNIVTNVSEWSEEVKSDGLMSLIDKTPLAIVTADCLPIVLIGDSKWVFIHAGWKGLATGILGNNFVQEINPNYAFIGPHISVDNYEVGLDFKDNFPNSPNSFEQRNNKVYFNLEIEAKRQLNDLYGPIAIESSNICTYIDSNFHSYRKDKTKLRNWNIIRKI